MRVAFTGMDVLLLYALMKVDWYPASFSVHLDVHFSDTDCSFSCHLHFQFWGNWNLSDQNPRFQRSVCLHMSDANPSLVLQSRCMCLKHQSSHLTLDLYEDSHMHQALAGNQNFQHWNWNLYPGVCLNSLIDGSAPAYFAYKDECHCGLMGCSKQA